MVLYVADELSYDRFHAKADRVFRVTQEAEWATGSFKLASTSAPFAQALQNEYPEIEKTVRISAEGAARSGSARSRSMHTISFSPTPLFLMYLLPISLWQPATALREPQKIVLTKTLATNIIGDASKAVGQTVFFSNNYPNMVTGVIDDVPANSHLNFSALRSLPPDYTGGMEDGTFTPICF